MVRKFADFTALSRWTASLTPSPATDWRYDYDERFSLYRDLILSASLEDQIDYLEFGVFKGESLAWWASANQHPASRFFGFDTFTGLPEDWGSVPLGTFNAGGAPPVVTDPRVSFVKGLFQDSLSPFLKSYQPGPRRVVHLDADLYSSTLYALTRLYDFLTPGDVLIFDEFNSPSHEFRAFCDFADSHGISFRFLGQRNGFQQAAFLHQGRAAS